MWDKLTNAERAERWLTLAAVSAGFAVVCALLSVVLLVLAVTQG
jgi:hypothetical protein